MCLSVAVCVLEVFSLAYAFALRITTLTAITSDSPSMTIRSSGRTDRTFAQHQSQATSVTVLWSCLI
uniref:Putative secreted protein n=1 Tax=Anopheles darlingi TaxID=43151 RepID=A0A2M4DBZ2_ANODA